MCSVQKILVFRLSSIGDIVLTTALVRCLRNTYPKAQIDYVVKKQFADILRCVPFVSNVIVLDTKKGFGELQSLRRRLKEEKYDVVLDIHKNWRSLFICNSIGAKFVFRFKKHVFPRWVLTTFHKDIYSEVRPVYLRFIDAATSIGVKPDGNYTELVVPEIIQSGVDEMFRSAGLSLEKRVVALCPGASFSNKQWPPDKFLELAKKIILDLDSQVILLGGKKESSLCEEIARVTGAVNFSGMFDLSQSIAALHNVWCTVSNDTGMLHVSEALGKPVVGVYGPTARQFGYFPILPSSRVAQVDGLKCRPCTKMGMNHCPKKHFSCMREISVDMVYSLVLSMEKR